MCVGRVIYSLIDIEYTSAENIKEIIGMYHTSSNPTLAAYREVSQLVEIKPRIGSGSNRSLLVKGIHTIHTNYLYNIDEL